MRFVLDGKKSVSVGAVVVFNCVVDMRVSMFRWAIQKHVCGIIFFAIVFAFSKIIPKKFLGRLGTAVRARYFW